MDTPSQLRNRAAIVGVGATAYGSFPETDEYGLAADAFRRAIADCGLDKNQIDGLLVCRIPSYFRMGEVLGLDSRWTLSLPPHGRMSGYRHRRGVVGAGDGSGELCRAALRKHWPLAPCLLRRRRNRRRLGHLWVHLARRRARHDVSPAHGALRYDHSAARRGAGRLSIPRLAESERRSPALRSRSRSMNSRGRSSRHCACSTTVSSTTARSA